MIKMWDEHGLESKSKWVKGWAREGKGGNSLQTSAKTPLPVFTSTPFWQPESVLDGETV